MHIEALRDYCLGKPGATEDLPFGPDVLAFKVRGKIFALVNLEAFPTTVNLKCAPDRAVELREAYEAVQPGYHMNKRHWNTVLLDGSLDRSVVIEMLDDSYTLVVKGLKKADREALAAL